MIYHCGKFDEDRIPSNCEFKTNNSRDMLDHINHGHSFYYCHRCNFKTRNRDDIEDHSHYEGLLYDIFTCNICGGPVQENCQICRKCYTFHSAASLETEELFFQCEPGRLYLYPQCAQRRFN